MHRYTRSVTLIDLPLLSLSAHNIRRASPACSRAARLVVPALLWTFAAAAGPAAAGQSVRLAANSEAELPIPASGKEAVTILALVDYQFDGCDRLSDAIITRWQRMAGSPEHQEQRIRDWILQSHTSEMAGYRKAGDLAEQLLDRIQTRVRGEARSSLRRMADHTRRLCDLSAVPVAPFESFQLDVVETAEKIEREVRELGRLVLSDQRRMSEAIAPYLPTIQTAAVQAEGEFLDFLESEKPKKPEGPTLEQLVQHWYHEVYLPVVIPSKKALRDYLRARDARARAVGTSCRDLSRAVIPVLRDGDRIFGSSPIREVEEPLRKAYVALQAMAADCSAGRIQRAQQHLDEATLRLRAAAAYLQPFGVSP